MTPAGWRAFVGGWDNDDPEWTNLDERGITWEQARDLITGRLERFRGDDCLTCVLDAAEGLEKLAAAQPGTPFEWNVEGDDYVIVPDGKASSEQ